MKRKRFNEKGEELQSLSIDLAKKILRDQKMFNRQHRSWIILLETRETPENGAFFSVTNFIEVLIITYVFRSICRFTTTVTIFIRTNVCFTKIRVSFVVLISMHFFV